ncbi:endonuclease/exonuclease/phosphatase family protein [Nocardia sp. SC052]|uniref:endonuclease/exonuclease/phosphatase family protein n=1 Tax=Nocardia sichangensis TaxID=3385975 RepID=UPI0039A1D903
MPTDRLRIAAYNVENLFSRPRVMSAAEPVAAEILDAHARVNELFEHETYSAADKAEILTLLKKLRLLLDDGDPERKNTFAVLRKIRGQLLKRPHGGGEDDVTVVADGRSDWVGWVDLIKDRIDALAITHTARVIREVGADIVSVIEAEDRITLRRFSETLIPNGDSPRYPHVMLIDGNDNRGIDVGILSTDQYPILDIRSHVDDGPFGNRVFSRDCPEYRFTFPEGSSLAGQPLLVLVNHLKSKFGTHQASSDKRRRRQAEAVADIYRKRRDEGIENVVVLGDSTTPPTATRCSPCSLIRISPISPRSRTSTMATPTKTALEPSATAPRATRSTISCCHRTCSIAQQAAEFSAKACRAALTARCSRTSTP